MKPESVVRKDDLLKSIFGDDDVGPSEGCNPVIHEDASDISPVPRDLHPRQSWKLQGSICLAGERPPTKHQGVRRPSPDVLRPRRYRVSEIHCVGVDWNVLDHGREPDEILGVRSTLIFFK